MIYKLKKLGFTEELANEIADATTNADSASYKTASDALLTLFCWSNSKKGSAYWHEVYLQTWEREHANLQP